MDKYVDMKSPFTGGRVKEVCTTEEKEFRKESYRVHVRYYVCEDTGEQFTTTEQDTLQFNDLYSQYRVRHGIPFPDEIKEVRVRYGLNYSQMSRILGFGVNQYAKYENGEVPSESNGKMISAIRNKDVLLDLLRGCKETFQPSEYERIYNSIILGESGDDKFGALHKVIFADDGRSIYNGYAAKDVSRLFDMVRYIVKRHGEIFPTKLNKLMFYADFCHYRKTGQSISGLKYRALNFGPVPDHYATVYDNVPDLDKRLIEAHDMVSTLFTCVGEQNCPALTKSEKDSIEYVVSVLKSFSVAEVIAASHQENAWRQYSQCREYIPYDEAFGLGLL